VDNGDGTITAKVSLTGSSVVFAGIQLELKYDSSKLTVENYGFIDSYNGALSDINNDEANSEIVVVIAGSSNYTSATEIFSVTFKYTDLQDTTLQLENIVIGDENSESQDYSIVGGNIKFN
jgi:formyltetrahydrofolate synthetase